MRLRKVKAAPEGTTHFGIILARQPGYPWLILFGLGSHEYALVLN